MIDLDTSTIPRGSGGCLSDLGLDDTGFIGRCSRGHVEFKSSGEITWAGGHPGGSAAGEDPTGPHWEGFYVCRCGERVEVTA